jgi:hypothetical protein
MRSELFSSLIGLACPATNLAQLKELIRRDQAEIRRSVNGAFESGERSAEAVVHPPKERVRTPPDDAPINLSNALWSVRATKPTVWP